MKNMRKITVIPFLGILIMLNACGGKSNNSNTKETQNESQNSTSENKSIDGVYTGKRYVGGLDLVAKLTINGSRWSAVSQLGTDSPEYQNGVVKGNDLLDESGMIKIGYVSASGTYASINGYPGMNKIK
jgi:hypothetical protein